MRERTGVVEDTTVTYVVKGLLELMRDTVACATKATKDAKLAEEYTLQVELEYTLTHALRDIERLEHEVRALQEERRQRLTDVTKSLTESQLRLLDAQKGYATVEDVHDARQDLEQASAEHDEADQKMKQLEEQLWAAQTEEAETGKRAAMSKKRYEDARGRYAASHHNNGTPSQEARDEHHKARTEHRKLTTRLELEQSDIEKDYASKILELRQQQDALAAGAKQKVQDAEATFKKPTLAPSSGGGAVIPIKQPVAAAK